MTPSIHCPPKAKRTPWFTRVNEGYLARTSGYKEQKANEDLMAYQTYLYSRKSAAIKKRVVCGVEITPELTSLADAVEASRKILNLEYNWDGEGSLGYEKETWVRAVTGLLKAAHLYVQCEAGKLKVPAIYNGPEGSIDILWEADQRQLLVNVPRDNKILASYYGCDPCGETRGTFTPSDVNRWLMLLRW